MSVRAMFIDMDGTLLTAANRISDRNRTAINRLVNQGVKVFLATGRHYEITAPYHKELGLRSPMICLNGAVTHDALTGRAMQMNTLRLDEERFYHLIGKTPCNVIIHTANGFYCKNTNEEIDYWTQVGQIGPKYIGDLRHANYQDVLKYSIRTGGPCRELSALFKKEAQVIDWEDGFEMVAPDISKWSAIKTLLDAFGINPSEAAAIGDGPNDTEMLRRVGIGAAMGNAGKEAKAAADVVTGHHEKDGLAEFIERYLEKSVEAAVL
ncbi:HAD family hydrolase [Virgibacillus ihumii]|uniref:HAD family hydrolase n=1 Tax=Virgibacillus ihumii TaxID=2686091 RepID=UPI00157DFD11|nr:HAD family hydrolase [Virgibacillus ihumii]